MVLGRLDIRSMPFKEKSVDLSLSRGFKGADNSRELLLLGGLTEKSADRSLVRVLAVVRLEVSAKLVSRFNAVGS